MYNLLLDDLIHDVPGLDFYELHIVEFCSALIGCLDVHGVMSFILRQDPLTFQFLEPPPRNATTINFCLTQMGNIQNEFIQTIDAFPINSRIALNMNSLHTVALKHHHHHIQPPSGREVYVRVSVTK